MGHHRSEDQTTITLHLDEADWEWPQTAFFGKPKMVTPSAGGLFKRAPPLAQLQMAPKPTMRVAPMMHVDIKDDQMGDTDSIYSQETVIFPIQPDIGIITETEPPEMDHTVVHAATEPDTVQEVLDSEEELEHEIEANYSAYFRTPMQQDAQELTEEDIQGIDLNETTMSDTFETMSEWAE